MTECTHTKPAGGCWVDNPDYDPVEAELGGFTGDAMEWKIPWDKPTVVDINLHQYKCTQCGKVMNY